MSKRRGTCHEKCQVSNKNEQTAWEVVKVRPQIEQPFVTFVLRCYETKMKMSKPHRTGMQKETANLSGGRWSRCSPSGLPFKVYYSKDIRIEGPDNRARIFLIFFCAAAQRFLEFI